jgi:hypothetical protein
MLSFSAFLYGFVRLNNFELENMREEQVTG